MAFCDNSHCKNKRKSGRCVRIYASYTWQWNPNRKYGRHTFLCDFAMCPLEWLWIMALMAQMIGFGYTSWKGNALLAVFVSFQFRTTTKMRWTPPLREVHLIFYCKLFCSSPFVLYTSRTAESGGIVPARPGRAVRTPGSSCADSVLLAFADLPAEVFYCHDTKTNYHSCLAKHKRILFWTVI